MESDARLVEMPIEHGPSKYVFVPVLITSHDSLHNIFRKDAAHCTVCNRELPRHRYRPAKEWNIQGWLCADCHLDKTKDFMLSQQQTSEAPASCAICGKVLASEDMNKPKWQWGLDSDRLVCKTCYQGRDAEHNKRMNFCALCNGRLGMFFYHPKPEWKIDGNLCRKCWDGRNRR